jgi:hypothetical protein
MAPKTPDLSLLSGTVADGVLSAMQVASAALTRVGVRHTLVGGLAVGANGYPRATRDVDFLVGEEAFEHHADGLVTMRPGVPIQVSESPSTFCRSVGTSNTSRPPSRSPSLAGTFSCT